MATERNFISSEAEESYENVQMHIRRTGYAACIEATRPSGQVEMRVGTVLLIGSVAHLERSLATLPDDIAQNDPEWNLFWATVTQVDPLDVWER